MKKTKTKKDKTKEPGDGGSATRTVEGIGGEDDGGHHDETAKETTEQADPLVELRARVEKLEDSVLRAKADYQNLLRRSTTERGDAIRYANTELMRSLLVVVDDFERSLTAADASNNLAAVVEGVRLVYDNLRKALRDHGLEAIDALHKPFDPSVHEALMQQPSADHPPGTVVEQVATGYRLRDRVVRPAKVVVSRAPEIELPDSPLKA